MANIKSNGTIWDGNLVIETGATITAGSLIWADISGTNVVRAIRPYSGTTVESSTPATGRSVASLDGQIFNGNSGVFLGVLAKTQTGVPNLSGGHQTGVTWYASGVFQFRAVNPTGSCVYRIGFPAYAVDRDAVRCGFSGVTVVAAAGNLTGSVPIGTISYIPSLTANGGHITTGSTIDVVRVKISTDQSLQRFV